MLSTYVQVHSCSPSLVPDSYIYSVLPVGGDELVALTSADELLLLNKEDLKPVWRCINDVPKPASVLTSYGNAAGTVICAGGDGVVAVLDVRSRGRVAHFQIDRPVTAVAYGNDEVAAGSEVLHSEAIITIWDARAQRIRWRTSANNDDITALHFHPKDQKQLLSGGDDGLVSVFDTAIEDEDESLIQAFDHGPIHKSGFLSHSSIYALSADQQLSIHPILYPGSNDDDVVQPLILGDLRALVNCDYIIDVLRDHAHPYIAAGSHVRDPHIDLIPLVETSTYSLSTENILRLEKVHGEDIVRSVYLDDLTDTIFTAGEDGYVKTFRASTSLETSSVTSSQQFKGTSTHRSARFRPY